MKRAAACLLIALLSAGAPALAQAAGDPVDKLRACSSLTESEKAKCLGSLPREIAPEPARSRAVSGSEGTATLDSWIFSETTSPIDYSPVVVASAMASGAPDGSGMKLSIACRGGNTSLMLIAPGALPAGEGYTVSYIVDGGSPTTLTAAVAPFGTGMILGVDVVRFLVLLPAQGEIVFLIVGRQGGKLEGRYSLTGLRTTRERMAVSCKWPIKPETMRK
jgi:hypothetical protein